MWAMESGIYLYRGKHLRITPQVGFASRKARLLRARDTPSGGPDINLGRHASILCAELTHSVGAGKQPLSAKRGDPRIVVLFRSTTSCPSCARAQGDEKLVQLPERLTHRIRRAGTGGVEGFFRGI